MGDIGIIGSGYVGLVTGTCLSDFGWSVTCADRDETKISLLQEGVMPIYEPGLEELVSRNTYYKRLKFSADVTEAIDDNEVIFIAVGTPEAEDGSVDVSYVLEAAREIGRSMNSYKVIVNKSTVPVGMAKRVETVIKEELLQRGEDIPFDVVSNPEFLREGSAVQDFTHTDRVVIGADSEKAIEMMKKVYKVLYLNETPFVITNTETAELIKYASNAFLATKVAFVNELSELCEKTNGNIQQVSKAMGMDKRIGDKFLHAGPGYGGSCFPKDTRAIVSIGENYNCTLGIINATIAANEKQKLRMVHKILDEIGSVEGKVFGILGLAFKNNTDDMRESPALTIMNELAKRGACFKVYDPKAMNEARKKLEGIEESILLYGKDEYEACLDVDAVVIITEWNQFRNLDFDLIKENMRGMHIFDFRNIYSEEIVGSKGFRYISVGR